MTTSERLLWNALRDRRLRGLKFRRQARIGHSIVDLYCAEHSLVIEVDGGIHQLQRTEDAERQAVLEGMGFRLLRVNAQDVENDLDLVIGLIGSTCLEGPSPSKRERGGRRPG
jgi:very-short-patch-repair endonuclease